MTEMIFTVDGGGTKTRGVLYSLDGKEVASAIGGAGNLLRGVEKSSRVVTEIWQKICHDIGISSVDLIEETKFVAGLAGAQFEQDREQFLLGIPSFKDTIICSDGYMALMGATEGGAGSLLVVGTGVVGHRLKKDGECVELGGWGFPIGDVGGGAWLGWQSVSHYVQWLDNRNINSSMWRDIGNVVGIEKRDIISWSQNALPSSFGKLSPIIIQAMENGDSIANEIFLEGLESIYLLSMALKNEGDTCFYAGGLAEVIVKALNARYARANASLSNKNSNWGAYLVALGQAPLETFYK